MAIRMSAKYRPSEKERYMSLKQLEYFRQKLLRWRARLLDESNQTLIHLREDSGWEPDFADRATAETDRSIELRTRDRESKLIAKIDAALQRIEGAPTGSARRPANRSACSVSRRVPSPPSASTPRSATSTARRPTATTSAGSHWRATPPQWRRSPAAGLI